MNGRRSAFTRVAEEIDDLVGRLAEVVCPVGADISAAQAPAATVSV